jgi:hypothetical protein
MAVRLQYVSGPVDAPFDVHHRRLVDCLQSIDFNPKPVARHDAGTVQADGVRPIGRPGPNTPVSGWLMSPLHTGKTAKITIEADAYQITAEDGIAITAARTTSRDIKRHKASRYPDRDRNDSPR